MLEFGLVDIVLILAHANALGIDLYKFGQRVHQSSANRHGTTNGHVLIGELVAGNL